jgi:hypothetical protein
MSFTTIDGKATRRLRLEPDRTLVIWSLNHATNEATAPSQGTWKVSGRELVLSVRANWRGPPKSFSSWVDDKIHRLKNPKVWADSVTSYALEDVRANSARIRELPDGKGPDGKGVVLHRVESPQPADRTPDTR